MNQLDIALVERGVRALTKHLENRRKIVAKTNILIDLNNAPTTLDDKNILLQITLKKITQKYSNLKPKLIDIAHPIFDPSTESMCLIVKNDDDEEKIKDLIENNGIGGINMKSLNGLNEVISINNLRKSYKTFQNKRELIKKYDKFLVDNKILPLMFKTCGKTFFKNKKNPIPIKMKSNNLNILLKSINKVNHSTVFFHTTGHITTVKIGRTSQTNEQIVENCMEGINNIIEMIPNKWKNIMEISVKGDETIALPIYNRIPLEIDDIISVSKNEEEKKNDDIDNDENDDQKKEQKNEKKKKKKRKRNEIDNNDNNDSNGNDKIDDNTNIKKNKTKKNSKKKKKNSK